MVKFIELIYCDVLLVFCEFDNLLYRGPEIHKYLNEDPEILAYRKKAKLERELEKTVKATEN